jgi:aquaporin Z
MAGSTQKGSSSGREPKASRSGDTERAEIGWVRRFIAEVVGTFALVFVAAGADTMAVVSGGQVSVAAKAVAPALMVAAVIYAMSDESGAHLNPSVSMAFVLRRDFPAAWLAPYWVAQLVGAVIAALVLRILFPDAAAAGVSTPHVASTTAVVIEAILTMLLVTVILGTADRARIIGPNAAIAVGATIAACGLIALPITGASMNPARSLGPAIVNGELANIWIYLAGPFLGAAVAALGIATFRGSRAPDDKTTEAARGEEAA